MRSAALVRSAPAGRVLVERRVGFPPAAPPDPRRQPLDRHLVVVEGAQASPAEAPGRRSSKPRRSAAGRPGATSAGGAWPRHGAAQPQAVGAPVVPCAATTSGAFVF